MVGYDIPMLSLYVWLPKTSNFRYHVNTLFYAGHVPLNVTNDFGAVNPGSLAMKNRSPKYNMRGVPKHKVQVLGNSRQSNLITGVC